MAYNLSIHSRIYTSHTGGEGGERGRRAREQDQTRRRQRRRLGQEQRPGPPAPERCAVEVEFAVEICKSEKGESGDWKLEALEFEVARWSQEGRKVKVEGGRGRLRVEG